MVESQIIARGVHDPRVLHALREIPRHRFVPAELQPHAYEDRPLNIGCGQTISQPYIVALMTQLLELRVTDRVLEVGTGSAYQAAVLAVLAAEVITIERQETLAERASERLVELGYANVTVVTGDGSLGYPSGAPFDAIIVTAAAPRVPPSLKAQLAPGGRLVCPTGARGFQSLTRLVRKGDDFEEHHDIRCVFVPLLGKEGWEE